jgi:hypothetical protein
MVKQPEDPRVDYCVLFTDYVTKTYVYTFFMKKAMTLEEFYKFLPIKEVMVFPLISKNQCDKLNHQVQSRPLHDVYDEWFSPECIKHILS